MNSQEYDEALIQKGYKKSPKLEFFKINQKLLKQIIIKNEIKAPDAVLFYSKRKILRSLLLNILFYKESKSFKLGTKQTFVSQLILLFLSPITIFMGGIPEFKKTISYIIKNEIQQLDYLSNEDSKFLIDHILKK